MWLIEFQFEFLSKFRIFFFYRSVNCYCSTIIIPNKYKRESNSFDARICLPFLNKEKCFQLFYKYSIILLSKMIMLHCHFSCIYIIKFYIYHLKTTAYEFKCILLATNPFVSQSSKLTFDIDISVAPYFYSN